MSNLSGINLKYNFDENSNEYSLIEMAVNAGRIAEREDLKKKKDPDFKTVEKLLYAYPDLKYKIELDKKEIQELEAAEFPDRVKKGKSKDIVMLPSGGSKDEYAELELLITRKKANLKITKREVSKIDSALERVRWLDDEKIKKDAYFRIIELKYFKCWNDDEISEELQCDPSTIRRNKNRLINRLKNLLL